MSKLFVETLDKNESVKYLKEEIERLKEELARANQTIKMYEKALGKAIEAKKTK